jgi:hyperosmotically inducible protein
VKAALIADPVTKAHQIDVEVFKGTVQLNGYVDTDASKERATEVAKATRGVEKVNNNLAVRPVDRTAEAVVDDGVITTKVKAALAEDSRTKAHQVNVETHEGVVQLSGFVDNAEAKSTAAELARNVEHVRSVNNQIDVKK